MDDVGLFAFPDSKGNMYLVNEIFGESTGRLVATPGVVQANFGGSFYWRASNAGIIKFNKDLSDVLFFTYLGGLYLFENPAAATTDPGTDDLYLMIQTSLSFYREANTLPITDNAYMPDRASTSPDGYGYTNENRGTLYLCRLSADGTRIIGSTYMDGWLEDGRVREGGGWELPYTMWLARHVGAFGCGHRWKDRGTVQHELSRFPCHRAVKPTPITSLRPT